MAQSSEGLCSERAGGEQRHSEPSGLCCFQPAAAFREREQEQKDGQTGTAWQGERQVQPAGKAEVIGVITGRLEVEKRRREK